MAAKLKVAVDTPRWLQMIRERQKPVATAAVAALGEAASTAVQEGRRNIAGAGKFGPSWQQGLQFRMQDSSSAGQASLQAKAIIFHRSGLSGVFEHGAVIQGKQLLWIPTSPGARPARSAGKRLVSATVRGKPMLFDAGDRDRHRKPLYIGVPFVRIPQKWHIIDIVKENARKLGALFLKHFKDE